MLRRATSISSEMTGNDLARTRFPTSAGFGGWHQRLGGWHGQRVCTCFPLAHKQPVSPNPTCSICQTAGARTEMACACRGRHALRPSEWRGCPRCIAPCGNGQALLDLRLAQPLRRTPHPTVEIDFRRLRNSLTELLLQTLATPETKSSIVGLSKNLHTSRPRNAPPMYYATLRRRQFP
jgi:hypothetical protein